jgi:hypothetical protein
MNALTAKIEMLVSSGVKMPIGIANYSESQYEALFVNVGDKNSRDLEVSLGSEWEEMYSSDGGPDWDTLQPLDEWVDEQLDLSRLDRIEKVVDKLWNMYGPKK